MISGNRNTRGHDYSKSFIENNNLIPHTDFTNKNNMIHNNVRNDLASNYTADYRIHIDSATRSYESYPNPYKFNVIFGGVGKTIDRNFNPQGELVITEFEGQPAPKIARSFHNVKFIRLDHIIIPRTNVINVNDNDGTTEYTIGDIDTENTARYRYMIVKLKGVGNNRIFSTNDIIDENSFIIYPEREMGPNHYKWIPTYGSIVYPSSMLHSLKKIDFTITDEDGNLLKITDQNNNQINTKVLLEELKEEKNNDDPILLTFEDIHKTMQTDIQISLGVVQNEINTMPSFR